MQSQPISRPQPPSKYEIGQSVPPTALPPRARAPSRQTRKSPIYDEKTDLCMPFSLKSRTKPPSENPRPAETQIAKGESGPQRRFQAYTSRFFRSNLAHFWFGPSLAAPKPAKSGQQPPSKHEIAQSAPSSGGGALASRPRAPCSPTRAHEKGPGAARHRDPDCACAYRASSYLPNRPPSPLEPEPDPLCDEDEDEEDELDELLESPSSPNTTSNSFVSPLRFTTTFTVSPGLCSRM